MVRLAKRLMAATSPPPLTAAFRANANDNTPSISRTFNAVSFGTAAPRRRIVLFIHMIAPTQIASSPGVSIGGVSATFHHRVGPSNNQSTFLYSAEVPTGASGTITISFANTVNFCAISVLALYDATTANPVDVASAQATATTLSATVTVPANGLLLAGAAAGMIGNSNWGGGGIGELSDTNDGTSTWTTGRRTAQTVAATVTPQVTWPTSSAARLIAAVWK